MKSHVAPTLLFVLICGVGTLWWGGCDFTAVDKGADVPLEELLASVSAASTPAEAERSIRMLLNKVEVGVVGRAGREEGAFDAYTLDDDLLASLAKAQVEFNAGEGKNATTLGEVYLSVLDANERAARIGQETVFDTPVRPITATVEEVLTSLQILARAALEAPEEPKNALLLAILADGAQVPGSVSDVQPAEVVSPAQRFLFSIWMHKFGPSLPLFSEGDPGLGKVQGGGGNQDCPNGTYLIAKLDNWKSQSNDQTVNGVHGWGSGSSVSWTSDLTISTIIVKGSNEAIRIDLVGGAKSGSFTSAGLINGGGEWPDISNIKFCGGFQACVDIAQAAFQACMACDGEPTVCEALYKKAVDECHDQGLVK